MIDIKFNRYIILNKVTGEPKFRYVDIASNPSSVKGYYSRQAGVKFANQVDDVIVAAINPIKLKHLLDESIHRGMSLSEFRELIHEVI